MNTHFVIKGSQLCASFPKLKDAKSYVEQQSKSEGYIIAEVLCIPKLVPTRVEWGYVRVCAE